MNKNPFEVIDSKIVYKNPWIKVREDVTLRKNGNKGIYSVIETGDSNIIIAVNSEQKICLIETYRHPIGQWVWELPGGGNDGDDPLAGAQRELKEETGLATKNWHILGKTRVCNGLSTEYQTNLLAIDVDGQINQLEDEIRTIKFVSLLEIDRMILSGEMSDNQGMTALYLYKKWLENQNN